MKMKKNIKYILVIALSVCMLMLLVSCGPKDDDGNQGHTHSFGEWSGTQPTCTEPGKVTRTCTGCDVVEEKITPATGHNIVNHEAKAPTCTEDGNKAYEACSNCNYTTFEAIPAQHNFVEGICSECGEEACEGEHSFGEWYGNTATCTSEGIEYRRCSECEFLESRNTDKAPHATVNHEAKEPTCTESGYKAYETCENCSYTTFEKIDAKGHNIVYYEKKNATCTEQGNEAYKACTNCSFTTIEVIPVHNYVDKICTSCGQTECEGEHSYGDWYLGRNPTCLQLGIEYRTCTICGHSEKRDIDKVAHKYENKTCIYCEKKDYTLPSQPLGRKED